MRNTFGLAIAAALIVSGATGAMAATTRHVNHTVHTHSAYRPGTIPVVPYGARSAFGAVAAPVIGGDCSQRPFARDCDKRGPW